ncbi:Rid family detoxifying hydrolase [Mucilaginibacter agri]|uniref:Reactive intermediate/imine deaminase n=1 Tax=Mucilaginibacter agri TaxID=2695265 RepID=A0A965ZJZ3_9SPHI|nr:Rid family detoxifying hydrolase [Mucilaginibacter agri]NCD72555.1 hypothetical protein [Mucilaginibacter agri]
MNNNQQTWKRYATVALLFLLFSINIKAQTKQMNTTQQSEKTVRDFLEIVRSGKAPQRAGEFLADSAKAHQLNAEHPETIVRGPENYAQHVADFRSAYGHYQFNIDELFANGDKVYARWQQTGTQIADVDGFKATGLPVTVYINAVFKVANGKIVEYWVMTDRKGVDLQLQANEKLKAKQAVQPSPYKDAVDLGNALYISGQLGVNRATGELVNTSFEAEADQAMKNIGAILTRNDLDYHNLVSVTVYLTNMDDYALTNAVYRKYFEDKFPARVCIAVKELPRHGHIEISAIAQLNK